MTTPLRQHLIADMRAKNLPEAIQRKYIDEVAAMAWCYRRSPAQIEPDQVRRYLVGCALKMIKDKLAAFEFFYTETMGWEWDADRLMPRPLSPPPPHKPWGLQCPLRRRMLEDLRLRNLAKKTQVEYIRWVGKYAEFHGQSPESLGMEDVRDYLVHLMDVEGKSASSYGVASAALRFLYANTLRRDWALDYIPVPKREKRLPVVLSQEEMVRFIEASPGLKDRAIVMTIYGAGLRTNELAHLSVTDIDSARMVIRVDQGKGRKDRYVMLSPRLLDQLRTYWRAARPRKMLFPGSNPSHPMSDAAVRAAVRRTEKSAGLTKQVTPRTLRHCFATHLLENGERLEKIQLLLGHRSLRTTRVYVHLATSTVCSAKSPLDLLPVTQ